MPSRRQREEALIVLLRGADPDVFVQQAIDAIAAAHKREDRIREAAIGMCEVAFTRAWGRTIAAILDGDA